jgi:hypothetical protein
MATGRCESPLKASHTAQNLPPTLPPISRTQRRSLFSALGLKISASGAVSRHGRSLYNMDTGAMMSTRHFTK